jgi:hypothetical protein
MSTALQAQELHSVNGNAEWYSRSKMEILFIKLNLEAFSFLTENMSDSGIKEEYRLLVFEISVTNEIQKIEHRTCRIKLQ